MIEPKDFETWLELIRSEQIPQEDVPRILKENPDFARWYRAQLRTDDETPTH